MKSLLKRFVRRRASACCEYCQMPEAVSELPFQIDHIIAEQHGGKSTLANLALSCLNCNKSKGPNIAGIDPQSRKLVRLFHPRKDGWSEHFRWIGPRLVGKSPVERTTIQVLAINADDHILKRRSMILEGIFPPGKSGKA